MRTAMRIGGALALWCGGVAALGAADPAPKPAGDSSELPVVAREDFEQGAARWRPTDPSAWKLAPGEKGRAGQVYRQFKKNSDYKTPHRSPLNLSILQEPVVGDFVLTAKVLSTHPDYGHRDACLVFGYQDPAHFYYVHFGKQTDDHANQVFIVNDKPRTKISTQTTPGTNWDEKWHDVKIVRKVADGVIEVYFDDMTKPVMKAQDKTFVWGRIGVGSFDDTSDWDDIEVRGVKVEPPQ